MGTYFSTIFSKQKNKFIRSILIGYGIHDDLQYPYRRTSPTAPSDNCGPQICSYPTSFHRTADSRNANPPQRTDARPAAVRLHNDAHLMPASLRTLSVFPVDRRDTLSVFVVCNRLPPPVATNHHEIPLQ